MPTRIQMRAQIRTRLEDLGAGTVWDDQTINDAIAAALLRYGARAPSQQTLILDLPPGPPATHSPSRRMSRTGRRIDPARIIRVLDERGEIVPGRDRSQTARIPADPPRTTLLGGVWPRAGESGTAPSSWSGLPAAASGGSSTSAPGGPGRGRSDPRSAPRRRGGGSRTGHRPPPAPAHGRGGQAGQPHQSRPGP